MPDQERQERQLGQCLGPPLVEVAAQLLERGDVDFLDIGEVRYSPLGLLHRLGDLAAEPNDLDFLDAVATRADSARFSRLCD